MQLHQLRALVAVADCGSISAAARQLGMSQPAVTRSLRQLEHDVGATLLERSSVGVTLTGCGEALLTHARQIVDGSRRAHEHIGQMIGRRTGSVAIASSAVPIALVLPQAVSLMRGQFPDVRVKVAEVVYPTVMNLFRDAAIDFAVGPVPANGLGEDFRCDPLFEVRMVPVLKRRHKLARARSIAELASLDWMITGPDAGPGAIHESVFVAVGLPPPHCVLHCESVGGAMQMIEHSDLASFVPEPMAEAAEAAGLVSIVRVKETLPPAAVSIFMAAERILTPAAQALYSAIRSVSRSRRRG
ncbi:MAG: LysR family transcriptional regulator [Burkholderiaceae bacterium]